jgi:hypothetical protein
MMPTPRIEITLAAGGAIALGAAYLAVVVAAPDSHAVHFAAKWGILAGGFIVAVVTVAALTWPAE